MSQLSVLFHTDTMGTIDISCTMDSLIKQALGKGFRVERTAREVQIFDVDSKLGYFLFDKETATHLITIDFCDSNLCSLCINDVLLTLSEYMQKSKSDTHSYIECSKYNKNMSISGNRCVGCFPSSDYTYCKYAGIKDHVITDNELGLTFTIGVLTEGADMVVVEKTEALPIDYSTLRETLQWQEIVE